MSRRSWAAALAVTSIAFYLAVSLRTVWLPLGAKWLDVGVELRQTHIVLALPGDDERRPFVAAALVKVGLAEKTVLIENKPTPDELDGVSPAPHLVTRKVFLACGLQPDQILLLPGQSTSTAEDLDALGHYLKEHAAEKACIVTNAYHTRRTRWTVRNRLPWTGNRIIVVSAPNPEFDCRDWWYTPEGLEYVLSEYLKLGWYFMRFGNGWIVLTGAAVLVFMTPYIWRRRFRPATAKSTVMTADAGGGTLSTLS